MHPKDRAASAPFESLSWKMARFRRHGAAGAGVWPRADGYIRVSAMLALRLFKELDATEADV